jgi:predicted aspartyl protease
VPIYSIVGTPPNQRVNFQNRGPIVEVEIVAPQFVIAPPTGVAGSQIPVQQPDIVRGFALVDTGASHTSIDLSVATRLKLKPTGSVKTMSVSETFDAAQYAVGYRIVGIPSFNIIAVSSCSNLAGQQLLMLIGRDMLVNAVFVYNGPMGIASLSW